LHGTFDADIVALPGRRHENPLKTFLKRLRSNALVSAGLYAIARPVHGIGDKLQSWTVRYVRRNGGTATYDGIDLRFPKNVGIGFLSAITWHGTGGFEPHTWRTLRRLIETSGTFLDIGANIGFYSVLAKRIAPAVEVISFEPVPRILEHSRAFHAANGVEANIHQVALSDRDGSATLFQPIEEESSASTLVADSWQARKAHHSFTVPTARLDSFLAGRSLRRPVAIKIDVEDHEAAALRGAAETIREYRPWIVCEILARPVRPDNRLGTQIIPPSEQHENAETLAVLSELGYAAFAITEAGYFRMTADDFRPDRPLRDFLLVPAAEIESGRNYFPELPARRHPG
jgi:FkbM family methyltransferase